MKHTSHNSGRPARGLLGCALASCLALGASPMAMAQSTSATLRGQVSGAGEGTTVTATNTATGFSRSVAVGANGTYSVAGLPPGAYKVDVVANGAASSQTVTLQVGQTATLNLDGGGTALTPQGDATNLDTVKVTAPALIESKTSEVATYVTQRQIESLPQTSRNFLAFADTVPGMKFETNPGDGSTKLQSGAQSANNINVFVDGVGQKN